MQLREYTVLFTEYNYPDYSKFKEILLLTTELMGYGLKDIKRKLDLNHKQTQMDIEC